ncbi:MULTISPECIES: hypothetical protein [unclassified Plantactinospora]|uniref:hypothetical protein n=1 Tax=unclassified Plantactinospora TaxID=2631981 RepID=UPI000D161602|nr:MULTISPECIES: hypothetical protein [unclassified Plantactinospora]AVT32265.1 hypothetical protein C6361_25550 [Plantactinospora sp. BC1]AVT37277.1 hypothetical protein C6W10_13300 [Plantactinospora sp. BB1]
MPVIPVRRLSGAAGALALAAVAVVAPAGPAQAAGSLDDELPRVIAEPAETSIPEGTGGSFRVRLSHRPAEAAFLQMRMRGTGRWISQPVMLQFTPTNWSNWQGYALGSVQDPDTVDDVLVITLSFPEYRPDSVTFTQVDDD